MAPGFKWRSVKVPEFLLSNPIKSKTFFLRVGNSNLGCGSGGDRGTRRYTHPAQVRCSVSGQVNDCPSTVATSSQNFSLFQKDQKFTNRGFHGGSVVKNPPANARDMGSIPGPGGSRTPQSNWTLVPHLLSLRSRAREMWCWAPAPQLLKPSCLEPVLLRALT